jgi:hypothetical protein
MRARRKRFVVTVMLAIMLAALLASLSGCAEEEPETSIGGGAEDPVVVDANE